MAETPQQPTAPQDADAPQESSVSRPPAGRTPRWRMVLPMVLIAVEAIALVGLQYADNAEIIPRAEAFLTKLSIVALGTVLLFLWFVFLAPAAPSLRRAWASWACCWYWWPRPWCVPRG